jgi:phosphoglycerate dehydrogenase-like enzyme
MVGFGPIGQEVARLARALGMEVLAVTRRPETHQRADVGWLGGLDDLPKLLAASHIVVVALPLNERTKGLLGPAEIAQMRPGSYLINVGRGALVDEDALYEGLSSGHLAGAAIDVWYRYPETPDSPTMPATRPFWELRNVILTPHISGWTESTVRGRFTFIGEQLARLSRGEPLRNVIYVGGS